MDSIKCVSNHVAFIWCLLWLAGGQTPDFTVNCPNLQDGKTSLVTATVNTSNFHVCDISPISQVSFDVVHPSGLYQAACRIRYPECNTTFNTNGCRCKDVVGDIYTYELNFVFDKARQTGSTLYIRSLPCVSSSGYTSTRSPCERYGPDTVTLVGPDVFDLHPTQPDTMTLTCVALSYLPGVTYSWSRSCDRGTSDSTCRFTPTVSDHNTNITCSAANTVSQFTRTASRTVMINYPPSTAPSINNYNDDDVLYTGDNLTLVCTVRGGNPLITQVIFTCDVKSDGSDFRGPDGVSSSVTFTSLVASDDGINCTCSAAWKHSAWYTLTTSRRLTVHDARTTDQPTTEVLRSDAQDKDGADGALSFGAGIGIGVAVGIACTVGLEAVICVLWRRKVKRTSNTAAGPTKPLAANMSSPETMREEGTNEPAGYSELAAAGPYQSLRLDDVGQRSVYQGLQKTTGVR